MMQLSARSAEFTTTLTLSEMELEVLNHISSYGLADIIHKHVTAKYSIETLERLFRDLRQQTMATLKIIQDSRLVFEGKREVKR